VPAWLRSAWAWALGGLLAVVKLRHKVIEQNLAIAFPGTDTRAAARRNDLWSASYRHLASLGLEILMLLGPMRRFARHEVEVRGVENWRRAKQAGKGVVFLSSHVGNWEVMAAAGAAAGVDIMLVTKHLQPEWLHRAIERGRLRCGVRATYEPRTLRDVLGHLKDGGTVGFVLDQYAGPPVGVRVPVFGVPVGTHTAPATLVRRTGAALLPAVNYRVPGGKWVVEILPPVAWETVEEPAEEIARNTAHYAAILERHIFAHPEQWLWIHRRFKGDLSPLKPGEWREGRVRR
jgi:KDO2-lipid IV(A) lauroyltransferase